MTQEKDEHMKVNETLNEGLKRAYEITLTGAELNAKVDEKLVEAQPEIEMKGFRKGKVPMALLKKQFGPRVIGEAMQEMIDGAMSKHFEDTGDRPATQPDVKMTNEDWKEGDDVEVAITYENLPEIPDVDLKKVKLEKMVVKAEDKDVTEALENLAKQSQNFEDRKKGSKAKDGDQIVIDFLGKVDGEPFDGGQADDYPLVLGSNSFIPGFEAQLVGAKEGDDVEVKVDFPAEYQAEHLAGKAAIFECKVKAVKAPAEAEINDELAKQFGAEDLAGLKTQIGERLEAEYGGASRAVMKRKLLDELDKIVKFELPPSLVDAEAGQIAHQLWHEDNPEVEGHDHPEIETTDEHKALAERRVRLGLLLAELGRKQEIEVTDAEMTQAIMNQARQYPGQERQFFEFVQQNQQMQQQMRAPIFEDKVVDYIFELAEVSEKTVKKAALEKAVEKLEEEG
jgi:trigger factor